MATKMVTDRNAAASSVEAAILTHADEMSAAFTDAFTPFLDKDEELPNALLFQQLVGRLIRERIAGLLQADKAHIDEQAKIIAPRLRRDEATAEVQRQLRKLRNVCLNLFGPELTAEIVVAEEGVAKQPKVLHQQAVHTLERLRNPELMLPEQTLDGVDLSPAELVGSFSPAVAELGDALFAVEQQTREIEATLTAKYAAFERFDGAYSASVKMLQGLFSAVGRPDLAGRLRPRRRRSPEGEPEAPTATGPPGAPARGAGKPAPAKRRAPVKSAG